MRILVFFLLFVVLFAPITTHAAADPRCSSTFITSPAANSTIAGVVTIAGSAQLLGAFVRYQVDFSTTGENLWVMLNSAPEGVENGTLARWDTTLIPDGSYDLRVRSIDTSGNYCETVVSPITIKQGSATNLNTYNGVTTSIGQVIEIPSLSGTLGVQVPSLPDIPYCTSPYSVGTTLSHSIRLCPGQNYQPFTILGDYVSVIGDANQTATVRSYGRSFGITIIGSHTLVAGINFVGTTAPGDTGNWLCLYEQCLFANVPITGGENYGGGILIQGSDNTVMNNAISGGVIGVAMLEGHNNTILNNQLIGLSGWGIYGQGPVDSTFVGNTLHDAERACNDPGGHYYFGGCESAGMVLMGAVRNLIANNACANSGNCYYLNGDGGRLNLEDKLYGNYCSAPAFNCFEITDAQLIEFDNNVAQLTADNDAGCDIWLVRAQILTGSNNQVKLCNHRGSKLDSTYEPPKPQR